MPKVWCADEGCMYNFDHVCKAKVINLSWNSVVTLWDGRQEFHKCRTRESPAEYRRKAENNATAQDI